jgi:hypothetical protein
MRRDGRRPDARRPDGRRPDGRPEHPTAVAAALMVGIVVFLAVVAAWPVLFR